MIRKGTKVKWKWGTGEAEGTVKETFTSRVSKTIQGTEVTRIGEVNNKALFIEHTDGTMVLKSESEVTRS